MLVVDVEGFEPAVVEGAARLLADPTLKIVILEPVGLSANYGLHQQAMHRSMLDRGFHTVRYDPRRRSLERAEGMDAFNTIYVRDFTEVERRVKAAESFRVDDHVL